MNQLANYQLTTKWANKTFPMDPMEITKEEDRAYQEMLDKGMPAQVAAAVQEMYPILAETQAIQMYLEDNPEMEGYLPVVETVEEALEVAAQDVHLTEEHQQMFKEIMSTRLAQDQI